MIWTCALDAILRVETSSKYNGRVAIDCMDTLSLCLSRHTRLNFRPPANWFLERLVLRAPDACRLVLGSGPSVWPFVSRPEYPPKRKGKKKTRPQTRLGPPKGCGFIASGPEATAFIPTRYIMARSSRVYQTSAHGGFILYRESRKSPKA